MSYEGFYEYLCEQGHYATQDASFYVEKPKACSCSARWRYWASVDETNGIDETCPWTFNAPKTQIGFHDVPHVDHRGNHYVTMLPIYQPDLKAIENHERGMPLYRWNEYTNQE